MRVQDLFNERQVIKDAANKEVSKKENEIINLIFANQTLKAELIDFLVEGCGYWFSKGYDASINSDELEHDALIAAYKTMPANEYIISKVDREGNYGWETPYTIEEAIFDNFNELLPIIEKHETTTSIEPTLFNDLITYYAWQAAELQRLAINDELTNELMTNWFKEMDYVRHEIRNIQIWGESDINLRAFFKKLSTDQKMQITEITVIAIPTLKQKLSEFEQTHELTIWSTFKGDKVCYFTLDVDENGCLLDDFKFQKEFVPEKCEHMIDGYEVCQYYVHYDFRAGEKIPEFYECDAQFMIDGLDGDCISVSYFAEDDTYSYCYCGDDYASLNELITEVRGE